MFRQALIVIFIFLLNGCLGFQTVKLPEDIGSRGLLVARVVAEPMHMFVPRYGQVPFSSVIINNTPYNKAFNDGYMIIPLQPGKYKLQAFRRQTSFDYRPGGVSTTKYDIYPIETEFRIASGKITSFATQVFVPNLKDTKRFVRYVIKDEAETKRYLAANHGKLYASIKDKTFLFPQQKYMASNKLKQLRQQIAYVEYRVGSFVKTDKGILVWGALGTIARLHKVNKKIMLQILDTPSRSLITKCHSFSSQSFCIAKDNKIYHIVKNHVSERDLPFQAKEPIMHISKKGVLFTVDDQRNIYASRDGGRNWQKNIRYQHQGKKAVGRSQFRFLETDKGVYLYSNSLSKWQPMLLFAKAGYTDFHSQTLPKENNASHMILINNQFVLGPHNDYKNSKSYIYTKSVADSAWKRRDITNLTCTDLRRTKNALSVWCFGPGVGLKTLISRDLAKTWKETN